MKDFEEFRDMLNNDQDYKDRANARITEARENAVDETGEGLLTLYIAEMPSAMADICSLQIEKYHSWINS